MHELMFKSFYVPIARYVNNDSKSEKFITTYA